MLLDIKERKNYLTLKAIPWAIEGDVVIIAAVEINEQVMLWAKYKYAKFSFITLDFKEILQHMRQDFRQADTHYATMHLAKAFPDKSAKNLNIPIILSALVLFLASFSSLYELLSHRSSYLFWLIAGNAVGILASVFKISLFFIGFINKNNSQPQLVKEENFPTDFPIYTVLIPLYYEAAILESLIAAIRKINYPVDKLDVKIIIEEDDILTLNKIKKLNLEDYFDVVLVPNCSPKTKPKALNYALLYALGEYVTVFDAEDEPEALQLKTAIASFRQGDSNLVCLQAVLCCNNEQQSYIAKMFSLEYVVWFEFIIRALEKLSIPITLGGSSNNFKTLALEKLGGWDPFNVTEDADLGLRIWCQGYKSQLLDSITYEEAPIKLNVWLKQRSRWIKGFMITLLVHLKNRKPLSNKIGWFRTLLLELFIFSNSVFFLIYFLNIFLPYCFFKSQDSSKVLEVLWRSNLFLAFFVPFIIALLTTIYQKRKFLDIFFTSIIFPLYLQLHNFAALRAIYQLITKPFYWEKTPHGFVAKKF
jgi:cellulose synthase/poly-beta-1,6-N-acetylglucosamine synthase-like glycosyltransferase